MANITLVNDGTPVANNTTTSITLTSPTGYAHDLLIACLMNKNNTSNTISAPSGWTEIVQGHNACTTTDDSHQYAVFWKEATTNTADYIFTKATDDDSTFYGLIVRYRGQDQSANPIDATTPGVTETVGAQDNVEFPAFDPTATVNRTIFVGFYGNDQTSFAAAMNNDVNPDCTTEVNVETSTGTDASIGVCSGLNDGTNIDARTWATSSTVDAGSTGVVFAVKTDVSTTRSETFEPSGGYYSGYDNPWNQLEVLESGCSINEDYATSNVPAAPASWGSYCCRIISDGNATRTAILGHEFYAPIAISYTKVEFVILDSNIANNQYWEFLRVLEVSGGSAYLLNFRQISGAIKIRLVAYQ